MTKKPHLIAVLHAEDAVVDGYISCREQLSGLLSPAVDIRIVRRWRRILLASAGSMISGMGLMCEGQRG